MKPNILVIMTDQHSKNITGCYGNSIVRTPNIDRLASEGVLFENAYTPSPVCVPARMSFMTGRLPHRNGVMDNSHILSSGIPTFAHVLGAAGFETSLMGKMHFVGVDHKHGFETRPLGNFIAKHPGTPEIGGPRWTKFPGSVSGQERISVETVGTGTTTYQWFDRQVADAGCRFLRDKAAGDDKRPFAAVVSFNLPHCPFIAPKELFDYYLDKVGVPEIEENLPATVQRFRERRDISSPPVSAERIAQARAAYFALCEYVDSLIGEVLECLEETGFAEDTIVFYCSDHGELAGEHGCWWKSMYYEGAAGIPLIARLPDGYTRAQSGDATASGSALSSAGTRTKAVVNLCDLTATFADIAGTEFPGIDGRSLMPLIENGGANEESDRGSNGTTGIPDELDTTVSELYDPKGGKPVLSRMIRSGTWKLWKFFDAENLPPVLFDLANDPGETHDLGTDPAYEGVRSDLTRKMLDGWNPDEITEMCEDASRSSRIITAWGKATNPGPLPETLSVPPPELEADVQLIP